VKRVNRPRPAPLRTSPTSDPTSTDAPMPTTVPSSAGNRELFIDFVRGFSLLVVVAWHWCFTIILWRSDGPHATNPIGFTEGMWTITWLLQVMPLFFFVGGYSNLMAWRRRQVRGGSIGAFAWERVKQLATPALALAGTWAVLGAIVVRRYNVTWAGRGVILVISPLWFIAAYLVIIAFFPLFAGLHDRFHTLVLVWLGGLAWLIDVTRFKHHVNAVGFVNMILVWGFCHQLGFFYERIVAGGRHTALVLMSGGLLSLTALVYSDTYPGSMVGVPGDRVSNMGPPTMCIVALVLFQAGVAVLIRPWVLRRLAQRGRWSAFSDLINRFSMPLFLFHTTGLVIAMYVGKRLGFYAKRRPDTNWWLFRPVSFIGPLVCTLPVIMIFGRRWTKPKAPPAPS
jgi:hypothetical protein